MRISCKYVSPAAAFSGYGDASRGYICALNEVGVELTTEIVFYDQNKNNYFGESFNIAKSLENKDIKYDIKIIHVPCDSYLKHLEPCKYHIGHLFWETDKMSPEWVWNCNLMDELWTGSEYNKQAFERSGVKCPIYVFPQAIDVTMPNRNLSKWEIPGHEGFLFYSIFQWIERKNPKALIEAYLKEFNKNDKVGLFIKTYIERFTVSEKERIIAKIWEWKRMFNKDNAPPIYINVELMDSIDVFRIHKTGDCFVLPHRGEGWGRPLAEAMLMGKPVIATNCGGIHDWLTRETYFPLTYNKVNVFNMEFAPWYRNNQKWADVNVGELQNKMREVYEDREMAKKTGKRAQDFVKSDFSYEAVGRRLKDRLNDIQKMLERGKKKGRWLRI